MRIDVALLAACVACGGARPGERRTDAIDDCGEYAEAMREPLRRLALAADRFDVRGLADAPGASRALATSIESERVALAGMRIADDDLRRAHSRLPPALDDMAAAVRVLADVLERRDDRGRLAARTRLRHASMVWSDAVEKVRAVCPID
jgi:hypothetical protein